MLHQPEGIFSLRLSPVPSPLAECDGKSMRLELLCFECPASMKDRPLPAFAREQWAFRHSGFSHAPAHRPESDWGVPPYA